MNCWHSIGVPMCGGTSTPVALLMNKNSLSMNIHTNDDLNVLLAQNKSTSWRSQCQQHEKAEGQRAQREVIDKSRTKKNMWKTKFGNRKQEGTMRGCGNSKGWSPPCVQ